MQVVRHDLQRQDFGFHFGSGLADDLYETFLERTDQNPAPAIVAPDQMIVDQEDSRLLTPI
jgi:hypothetical protein